ncbi:C45 family peptidase [Oceanobacillus sp. J11TS1]|uniref:C45 family autoproteolytic acyltransferase/hydolase n=1 Tax=Oceanobacillus sp. J11TS1 TaxID=2807191 RepID=UPI001B2582D5|nr:C45 family peptidase [Oceanobacillus sp. J11TS1]GIO21547.1 linear amide C-N hydrolase [Oceanobacillus sp. J11TS1]
MNFVHTDIIQFQGTHYQFGHFQAEKLKNSPILTHRKALLDNRWRNFLVDEREVEDVFKTFSPAIWEEIKGLSDGLGLPWNDCLREFGGYYHEYGRSGCSIYTQRDFLVRNYDNAPNTYEGRYVLYAPTDTGYASLGPSMQITGRTDGMNEKGLTMGYNFVNRTKSGDGFICNMIGRLLLENCATVEEAVQLLRELPHRNTFNYVLLDTAGKSIVVEVSPRSFFVREANSCTNHFDQLKDENRYRFDESLERLERIHEKQQLVQTPYEAFRMLNDTEQGIFSEKYGSWAGTLHTALYLPRELSAWIALGGNRQPFIFSFKKWLQGNKLRATKIKGSLNATDTFINT